MNDALIAEAKSVNVLTLAEQIGARLTPESGRREYSGPCPRCGGTDCFHVNTVANGWFCRKCADISDGGWKDTIDLLRHYGRMDFKQAVEQLTGKQLDGSTGRRMNRIFTRRLPKAPPPPPPVEFDAAYWTGKMAEYVAAMPGSPGESYLIARGLVRETWETFGIGFHDQVPVPGTKGEVKAPAIAIPWTAGGKLSGIRFRFFKKHDNGKKGAKQTSRGNFRGLLWGGQGLLGVHGFPGKPIERYRTLVVCEGELNAMSIWQVTHPAQTDVMSLGSQSVGITDAMKRFVGRYGQVIVWMDEKDHRERLVSAFKPHVKHIAGFMSPDKKDANDFLQSGDLQQLIAMLRIELASYGDLEWMERCCASYLDANSDGLLHLTPDTLMLIASHQSEIYAGLEL